MTVVQRDRSPRVAIVHDAQLNDDPELLNAAGAIALLAAESAELDAGWKEAMRDLERSRTRLVRAADDERRKFERNLHDGVQQHLVAIRSRLGMAAEDATVDGAARDWLSRITDNLEDALEEVRAVAHGLYPPLLRESGLVAALQSIQRRTPVPLSLDADGVGRYSPEVESAVYYSCLEAIQNATKHGGPDAPHFRDAAPGRRPGPLRRRGRRCWIRARTRHGHRPPEYARPSRRSWRAVSRYVQLRARAHWSPGACRGPLASTRDSCGCHNSGRRGARSRSVSFATVPRRSHSAVVSCVAFERSVAKTRSRCSATPRSKISTLTS